MVFLRYPEGSLEKDTISNYNPVQIPQRIQPTTICKFKEYTTYRAIG
jgi:hypothetical protein